MEKINLRLVRINPLTIPVRLAQELKLFEKYGVELNLTLDDDFFIDGNKAFLEGRSDAMMGDTTFFFYMLERGKKAMITSTLTRTIQLVGKNYPQDLSDMCVGVNTAGLFRLFLENDLKDKLVKATPVWINNTYERIQALEEKKIQAMVAIEPFVSQVFEKGADLIWHSNESDKILVMWAFDETFIKEHPQAVVSFHQAIEEAQCYYNEATDEEKERICLTIMGYDQVFANRMKSLTFESQKNYSVADFNLCQEWMFREGEISQLYDADCNIFKTFK